MGIIFEILWPGLGEVPFDDGYLGEMVQKPADVEEFDRDQDIFSRAFGRKTVGLHMGGLAVG